MYQQCSISCLHILLINMLENIIYMDLSDTCKRNIIHLIFHYFKDISHINNTYHLHKLVLRSQFYRYIHTQQDHPHPQYTHLRSYTVLMHMDFLQITESLFPVYYVSKSHYFIDIQVAIQYKCIEICITIIVFNIISKKSVYSHATQ